MLTYQGFGNLLLSSRDLDPIYVMLAEARLPEPLLKRWLLAYWCYYAAGPCSYIAEAKNFWPAMWQAYYGKWPRGMERRHFRGQAAFAALQELDQQQPEMLVDYMACQADFQSVRKHVQSLRGFGPWISWKVADMAERVLRIPVDFSNAELGIYRDPVKGAALLLYGDKEHPITEDELRLVVDKLTWDFRNYAAPPWFDRAVNIQEVETVLCKYKAYCYGFYPPGKDTREVRHGLVGWGDLATELQRHLPTRPMRWGHDKTRAVH